MELDPAERLDLIQHVIVQCPDEPGIIKRLAGVIPEADVQRGIDSLVGTQKVRRIGPDELQNNESHTELPILSEKLAGVLGSL